MSRSRILNSRPSLAAASSLISLHMLIAGCSSIRASRIDSMYVEPKSGGQYVLARPTNYDRNAGWPLVVLCHSGFSDSPRKQINEWTRLADERGFVVVAPRFDYGRRTPWRDQDVARDDQFTSTRLILNTVEHVRASHNISEDRILLYGYGRGAEPALHAGLLHPELFRAISLNQPIVENDRLPGRWNQVDPHQAIHVRYNLTDRLYAERYRALVGWLLSIGANVQQDTAGAADRDQAARAVAFFETYLRSEPWVSFLAYPPDSRQPLTQSFRVKTSPPMTPLVWDFGDGTTAPDREPIHTFAGPGTYTITVTLNHPGRERVTRTVYLALPEGRFWPRPPE